MVLFLLPLLFNPFGLAFSWLPFLYLSTWPLIVQTSGSEILMTHAVVLILFVLTCDITRQLMLKLIGFDLISLPAGLALLVALATDRGSVFLSIIRPLFGGLLALIEPLALLLELYVFLGIIKGFNRWLTKLANIRDEESQDLSSWEPPLTRGSLTVRAFVILLTLLSYVGVYIIINESKSFLSSSLMGEEELPLIFNHAIAALVTLQLIAISLTIYKEDGILSESAMIALLASIPIFVASLSYYHAKQTHLSSSATSWSSYFPFSLLFGSSQEGQRSEFDAIPAAAGRQQQQHPDLSDDSILGGSSQLFFADNTAGGLSFGQVQSSLLDGFLLDGQSKKLLSAPLKHLIMIINSILGLSVDKVAKYYFSPDFWYILLGRALCIGYWIMGTQRGRSDSSGDAGPAQEHRRPPNDFLRSLLSRTTVVKLLLILAYSQMLTQQMDNQAHLIQDLQSSPFSQQQPGPASACCHGAGAAAAAASQDYQTADQGDPSLADWFNCMWTNAKACGSSPAPAGVADRSKALFAHIVASLIDFSGQVFDLILLLAMSALQKLASVHLLVNSAGALWLARWRSPIVHRLLQSMLVQVGYIGSLLVCTSEQDDD